MKHFEEMVAQAVARADAAGYVPAALVRAADWEQVLLWARRAGRVDFVWQAGDGFDIAPMIVGPGPDGRTAIHTGQCRILGGLLAGNPVPEACLTRLDTPDPGRPWGTAPRAARLEILVPLECAHGDASVCAPHVLQPLGRAA